MVIISIVDFYWNFDFVFQISVTVLATGFPTDFYSVDGEGEASFGTRPVSLAGGGLKTGNLSRTAAAVLTKKSTSGGNEKELFDDSVKEEDETENDSKPDDKRKYRGIRGFINKMLS